VYLPTASDFTSVGLRWGSSSANYWSSTATTTHEGTTFQNGWNLIRYDWSSASSTGTPDSSAVNYLRITYNYNGTAQTAVRLDSIISRLGTIMDIEYYSKFLFRDASTGAFQETVTADTNLINLDTESYNLFLYLVARFCAQQNQGANSGFDETYFRTLYEADLAKYTARYKSELQKPQSRYYSIPNRSATRFIGRRR
jgi:hypothetical protein